MKNIFLALTILFSCIESFSQEFRGISASKEIPGAEVVSKSSPTSIDYIAFEQFKHVPQASIINWMQQHLLGSREMETLKPKNVFTDQRGMVHERYQHYYNDIPVEGSLYIVHMENGGAQSLNGHLFSDIKLSTRPVIDALTARKKAEESFPSENYLSKRDSMEAELVIVPIRKGEYKLAYRIDVYSAAPLFRYLVYIDAQNGEVLGKIDRIKHFDQKATVHTRKYGVQTVSTEPLDTGGYCLKGVVPGTNILYHTKNMGNGYFPNTSNQTNYDFVNADTTWGFYYDNAALDVHYSLEKCIEFYHQRFGLNSFDNLGSPVQAYVHTDINLYESAWDGASIYLGDGNEEEYGPSSVMEVVGHEFTHGVIENMTAMSQNFLTNDYSNHFEETMCDLMGMTIRHQFDTDFSWIYGEKIVLPGSGGRGYTSFERPLDYSNPQTYDDPFVNNGVDTIRIMNFWYYLLCEGDRGVNNKGFNYHVDSIGINKASEIVFRAMSVYFTPILLIRDIRYYTIQATKDLYGPCSDEVKSVINAWYAVGFGDETPHMIETNFITDRSFSCSTPATIQFQNLSRNGQSWLWDFGDGTTSTDTSPTHTYLNSGIYTVTLITSGNTQCDVTDTLIKSSVIEVASLPAMVAPNCQPVPVSPLSNRGIFEFRLEQIRNVSSGSLSGYQDFTCEHAAQLIVGNNYPFYVDAGRTSYNQCRIWIDANNDGVFDNSTELAYASNEPENVYKDVLHTSAYSITGVPLRLRVATWSGGIPSVTPCTNNHQGQTEDYTVIFELPTQAPIAAFSVDDTLIPKAGQAQFSDESLNGASSWIWYFPGGTPSTSSQRNPLITYGSAGSYNVSLVVQNAFGIDSISKLSFIRVESQFNLCGTVTSSNEPTGRLFDSGGPANTYSANENCSFLIQPPCATRITLSFADFLYYDNFGANDNLSVYDGTSTAAPKIGTFRSFRFPTELVAYSGSMYIVHQSFSTSSARGFDASWHSEVLSNATPVSAFIVSNSNPASGTPIRFTNQSSVGSGDYVWDFGDGHTSLERDPIHTYSSPGSYTVQLTVSSCTSTNTSTQTVIVQQSPSLEIIPDTLNVNVSCHDSVTTGFVIQNNGAGDLKYEICRTEIKPKILYLDFDTTSFTSLIKNGNFSSYLDNNFSNYEISEPLSYSHPDITAALNDKHVVILNSSVFPNTLSAIALGSILKQFITEGGSLLFLSIDNGTIAEFDSLDILHFFPIYTTSGFRSYFQPIVDPLTEDIEPFQIYILNNTNYLAIPTDTDIVRLLNGYNDGDHVAYYYRPIEKGKAIYWFGGLTVDQPNLQKILVNVIRDRMNAFGHLSDVSASGILSPGNSVTIPVTVHADQSTAGTHLLELEICTNDPNSPVTVLPVNVQTSGGPEIASSDSCIAFGNVLNNATVKQSLTIYNNGCDSLFVSGFQISGTVYSMSGGSSFIPPYDSIQLEINIHPVTTGIYNDTIKIFNNDQLMKICLSANVIPSTNILLHPDTISFTIPFCDDSVSVPFTMYNNGQADLNYCIDFSHPATQLRVLLLKVDTIESWPVDIMDTIIKAAVPAATIDIILNPSPTALDSALLATDVLIIPEIRNGNPAQFTSYAGVLQSYVGNGGQVILNGTNAADAQCLFNTGLIHGSPGDPVNMNGFATIVEENSPISSYTTYENEYFQETVFLINITDSDKVVYSESYGRDAIVYRNIGCGRVIYFGHNWYFNDLGLLPFPGNVYSSIIRKMAESKVDSTIWIQQTSGSIQPGDSINSYLVYHRNGLAPGTYQSVLIFHSNDPVTPYDTLNIICHVLIDSCYSLSMYPDLCGLEWSFNAPTYNGNVSYNWDFGDGTTSTAEDPVHQYSQSGVYQVRLILCVETVCDTIDTLLSVSGLISPLQICPVTTQNYCCNVGIINVNFSGINRTTGYASEGCLDFTCTDSANVIAGQTLPLIITTNNTTPENLSVWIDFNNSGVFEATEQVMNSVNVFQIHVALVTIPMGAVLQTPLRMRVMDESQSTSIAGPCSDPDNGQAEDYTVILNGVIGLEDIGSISMISVQPNPFNTIATLSFSLSKTENVEVLVNDVTGRTIQVPNPTGSLGPGVYTFQLQPEAEGVYLVSIKTETEVKVLRIIKVK